MRWGDEDDVVDIGEEAVLMTWSCERVDVYEGYTGSLLMVVVGKEQDGTLSSTCVALVCFEQYLMTSDT